MKRDPSAEATAWKDVVRCAGMAKSTGSKLTVNLASDLAVVSKRLPKTGHSIDFA
jgi:hypothetical protein